MKLWDRELVKSRLEKKSLEWLFWIARDKLIRNILQNFQAILRANWTPLTYSDTDLHSFMFYSPIPIHFR